MYVKGRLHSKVQYWREILKAPSPVINIVERGYILPFLSVPERHLRIEGLLWITVFPIVNNAE